MQSWMERRVFLNFTIVGHWFPVRFWFRLKQNKSVDYPSLFCGSICYARGASSLRVCPSYFIFFRLFVLLLHFLLRVCSFTSFSFEFMCFYFIFFRREFSRALWFGCPALWWMRDSSTVSLNTFEKAMCKQWVFYTVKLYIVILHF